MVLRPVGMQALFLQPFLRVTTVKHSGITNERDERNSVALDRKYLYCERLQQGESYVENMQATAAQVKRPPKIPVPTVTTGF